MKINTAGGLVDVNDLGRTLMHEHLMIGFPGWETDTNVAPISLAEATKVCVGHIEELKDAGISSLLDPCPIDLGRDVALMGEVQARTGFNIVFATGLYHGELGSAYWRLKFHSDPDAEKRTADLFIRELTEGVGDTGLKAGVIKIATNNPPFGDYEKAVFRAAARASLATGAPITTHTDGVMGDEQLAYLTSLGVPAHQIVIGHSCGSDDHDYHVKIAEGGAYVGFDRFGVETIQPDSVRVDRLAKLVGKGYGGQVIVSHDCPLCMQGDALGAKWALNAGKGLRALRFTRTITPMLHAAGVTPAQVDEMLIDNPRRYFAGEAPPARRAVASERTEAAVT